MHVRLTFISLIPEQAETAKRIFEEDIVPVIKQQKGNIDVMLLQPADGSNEYISYTSWQSKEDADAYEASGMYRELVGKAKHTFARQPTLKTYNV